MFNNVLNNIQPKDLFIFVHALGQKTFKTVVIDF